MALTLAKNKTISLEKTAGTDLKKVSMGLGWDPEKATGFFGKLFNNTNEIDLDASCILLDAQFKKVDLVWFRQLQSHDGSIHHSGDNRTGDGDGDDESISVQLQKVPASVHYLIFTVNSFTGQNFGKVANAYCRIVDEISGNELARFDLSEKGSHTGIIMAYLSRSGSGWNFTTVGQTTHGRTADDLINLATEAVKA